MPLEFEWSGVRSIVDGLHVERGSTLTGEPVLLLTADTVEAQQVLRNEVTIGVQLTQTFPSFPPELSRLVGFNASDRPTLAVVTCAGEELSAERVRGLPSTALRAAAESLLDALTFLAEARIAHRAITPRRLYWDGARLQLTGFGHAVRTLPPVRREPGPAAPPWTAPEQLRGEGVVSTADDLYGAAAVLFWMFTGETPGEAADMQGRIELQSDDLRARLTGMFAEPAERRPALGEVRRRWRPPALPGPRPPAFEERDRDAEAAFAAMRRRQAIDDHLGLVSGPVFGAGQPRALNPDRRLRLVAAVVALAVILTAVAALAGW
ncbi:protein kinase domain-containing protein [Actinoplanes sp. NPDC049118]|uniref:protein kinase domain-containing protein n=1 Tax=Actinoplanes sp. NPDC049118 TaxID=3155769 RepID=UPI0033DC7815